MMYYCQKNEHGVSPVIGVILMVAITVILAAVVGVFVLDITGSLSRQAEASVTFDEDAYNGSSGELKVQLVAIQNADSVMIEAPDGTNLGKMSLSGETVVITIEGTADYPNKVIASGDTVTAIGILEDNKSTLQTYTTE